MSDPLPEAVTITVEEAAALAGVGRSLMFRACKRGKVPGMLRIGRRIVLNRIKFLRWLGEEVPRVEDQDLRADPNAG